jgi:hypothetical protein
LQIVSGAEKSSIAQAIAALQDIVNSDTDCLDVTVSWLDMTEETSYVEQCHDCMLTKFQIDTLDFQKGDDMMAHVTMTFQPTIVKRLSGPQIG